MENILMSNLNDFIGRTSLSAWKTNGVAALTTHGPYDSASSGLYGAADLQILGTTVHNHSFGKEFKLEHVPDRKVFMLGLNNDSNYNFMYVKINTTADRTNAPNPSVSVVTADNLVPTLQAVARCLSFKIYTKQTESDAYVLKDTISMSTQDFGSTYFGTGQLIASTAAGINHSVKLYPSYTSGMNAYKWQEIDSPSNGDFGRIVVFHSMPRNIDDCFIKTANEGPIYVKVEWVLDTTAYNAIFSRSYNEVEGLKFMIENDIAIDSIYSGQRTWVGSQGNPTYGNYHS